MSCQRVHLLFFLSLRSNGRAFGPRTSFTTIEMKPYSSGQKNMHVNIGSEGLSRTALISRWTRRHSQSESHSRDCSHSLGKVWSWLCGPQSCGRGSRSVSVALTFAIRKGSSARPADPLASLQLPQLCPTAIMKFMGLAEIGRGGRVHLCRFRLTDLRLALRRFGACLL